MTQIVLKIHMTSTCWLWLAAEAVAPDLPAGGPTSFFNSPSSKHLTPPHSITIAMKLSTVCTIAAAAVLSVSQVQALSSYLKKIPNGDSFAQALGHPDNDSSKFTDFATAFSAASLTWDATFCNADFKTTDTTISMTNGEAFGDPCCTWTVGGTPDFTVTAFTISPTEKTVCASSSAAASTTASTASSAATSAAASSVASTTTSTAASSTSDYSTASSAASATEDSSASATEDSAASATEAYSTDSSAASTTEESASSATEESAASTTEESAASATDASSASATEDYAASATDEYSTASSAASASMATEPTTAKCNVRRG